MNVPTARATILDILLSGRVITDDQFNRVKLESINTGILPEQILINHNFVDPQKLAQAKSQLYNVPYVNLSEQAASHEALNTLPEIVARRYLAFPLSLDKEAGVLSVALVNPLDLSALEFLEKKTGFKIKPLIAAEVDVKLMIDEKYSQSLSTEVTEALKESGESTRQVVDISSLTSGVAVREAPITKIVATILEFAMKSRASDIHIEPQEDRSQVRYRIEGILQKNFFSPGRFQGVLIPGKKILWKIKINKKRVPQDGRFT